MLNEINPEPMVSYSARYALYEIDASLSTSPTNTEEPVHDHFLQPDQPLQAAVSH